MPIKIIDELMMLNHSYLRRGDLCFFFGEYTSRAGYAHSTFNQFMNNFKKEPSKRNSPEWKYKIEAINIAAQVLTKAIEDLDDVSNMVFSPIPPSKTKKHTDYDDRLLQVLNLSSRLLNGSIEIKELFESLIDRDPLHKSQQRLTPNQLAKNIVFHKDLLETQPREIVLFDDLITSGTHFRTCKDIINDVYPQILVTGLFIGRRVFANAV
jgi:hypothetical protein